MLQTKNLAFQYPGGAPMRFPDLAAQPGQPLLILGASGQGKTTLLHLMAGLISPKSGEVQIGETNLGSLSTQALDRFRGQHIGLVFQTAHFVRALTVGDNLRLAQSLAGQRVDNARVKDLLDALKLADKIDQKPYRLSLGEQQRATIARAVINRPALVLADEPTSALDDPNADRVISLLEQVCAELRQRDMWVTLDLVMNHTSDQHAWAEQARAGHPDFQK
ncbi:MAG: ATP-binding cassette domain-containing protein, partial [Bacteroidota bacterium]